MMEQKTLDPAPAAKDQPDVKPPQDSGPAQPKPRSKAVPLIIIAVLVGAGFLIWRLFFFSPPIPDNVVTLSGRIEGDDSAVAPKTSGRILEIRVREGDTVKAGDIIAILDDEQVRARQEQAQAALLAAQARTVSAQAQTSILQEQLKENQLYSEQCKVDSQGRGR